MHALPAKLCPHRPSTRLDEVDVPRRGGVDASGERADEIREPDAERRVLQAEAVPAETRDCLRMRGTDLITDSKIDGRVKHTPVLPTHGPTISIPVVTLIFSSSVSPATNLRALATALAQSPVPTTAGAGVMTGETHCSKPGGAGSGTPVTTLARAGSARSRVSHGVLDVIAPVHERDDGRTSG